MTNTILENSPSRPSADELRRRLEQSRQATLKMKIEERRKAESLQRMIVQLRTSLAA